MAEKKTTKAAAPTTAKKAAASKKETVKKVVTKKSEVAINAENVGFKAGDVYQALASEAKALTVAEIEKTAKISKEEVLLGLGWLLKEGKVKDENNKIVLA
ncbi:winged helix-turn-helix domain-containing protein [Prevotella koreensis]|uniref:winged helix-turn-helix domain-containing protein n=1 Tax=Prevotella koreensis TaxID=2490854 RepID=UPI0028E5F20F|nr:winged helix-turn-helix domain-containing protein [Prevotella koreensis]